MVDGKTGSKYEILVQSLSEDTQNLIDFEKSKNKIEKQREPILRKNKQVPPHALQIALARYDLVNLWVDYRNSQKNKTEAGKDFIATYNLGKLYPILFNVVGKISIGTIYRWHKKLQAKSDYRLLIPNYDYGEKECTANLTPDEELIFKSLLLSPNKINIGKATNIVIKNSIPEGEPKDGRPEFESRCERYEWHLNNGFANDSDVVWFKEYEQTDKYKQIYGGRTNAS